MLRTLKFSLTLKFCWMVVMHSFKKHSGGRGRGRRISWFTGQPSLEWVPGQQYYTKKPCVEKHIHTYIHTYVCTYIRSKENCDSRTFTNGQNVQLFQFCVEHRALWWSNWDSLRETGMVGHTIIRLDFIYSTMLLNTRKFRRKVEYTGQLIWIVQFKCSV